MIRPSAPPIVTALCIGAAWLTVLAAHRAPARAQELLSCGLPLARHLDSDASDSYFISVASGSVVEVDVADASGTLGLLKLESADQETCSGTLELVGPVDAQIEVSDCLGENSGDYTITANVVTQGAGNCGLPMPCGLVPHARHFNFPGEVDSYAFAGSQGAAVTLIAGDITGASGSVRLRVFDPDGTLITNGDSCGPFSNLRLQQTGNYTVLASACGAPNRGLYGLSFESPSCPAGPEITYFGVARADGAPRTPQTFDQDGRPVYASAPSGIFLVTEARPGPSAAPVGFSAFNFDPNKPSVLPDLQVLFSRPLGDGSMAVCDKTAPHQGGVPAISPLEYADTQAVADAINDFGCRVDDGAGKPQAVTAQDACTYFPDLGEYHFVDQTSTLQFCAPIARPWSFPRGATIVEARVRDVRGNLGPPREIVVQVGTEYCAGDCNGDFQVTIDELLTSVSIALGNLPLAACAVADLNGDGTITVDEIVAAVKTALNGCP